MDAWQPIIIFEGEDEEALKTEFVRLMAKYRQFTPYEVAQHVFRNLKEPNLRSQQAAEYWGKDLDIVERVRQIIARGDDNQPVEKSDIERRLLAIADNMTTLDKDKIDALKTLAQIGGHITKPIDLKLSGGAEKTGLPVFEFVVRSDIPVPTHAHQTAD